MKILQILAFVITIFLFIDKPQEEIVQPEIPNKATQQKADLTKFELKHEEVAKLLFKKLPVIKNVEVPRTVAMSQQVLKNSQSPLSGIWGFNSKTQVVPFIDARENRNETTELFYGINVSISF
ncbi:MAG: hypothetical protein NE334_15345 [Lentisphaeraceae bacterium]|nr:hypothetical protein [Lentisphaeraceae bacterium]